MNVVFILYYSDPKENTEPQSLCAMYGYTLARIDLTGTLTPGPFIFQSIDDALEDIRWKNWTWIFCDPQASDPLSKFQHQKDKCIYVFGDDIKGYDRVLDQLPGALMNIDTGLAREFEHTAAQCAEAVIIHRYYQVDA